MHLIVGLGNPGKEYEKTRHNLGFLIVDAFVKKHGLEFRPKRSFESEMAEGQIDTNRIIVAKPQTFMNISGRAVLNITKKHPITTDKMIIVFDDVDIKFGDVRIKKSGSSAGHKGMESIIQHLSSNNITRLRAGIGRPSHPDIKLEDFVLQKWTKNEEDQLQTIIENSIKIIEEFIYG